MLEFAAVEEIINSWYPIIFVVGFSLIYCLRSYLKGAPCLSQVKLKGKTAIITGGAGGMGRVVALDLARRGANVIIACRDMEKGTDEAEDIRKTTRNKNVNPMKLDLASFKSIKEFVNEFTSKQEDLHILVNNAGVMCCPQEKTEDNFDRQFQVNYLGHFYLTELLMDHLKKSAPSRIVNVSAVAYKLGKINFEDINMDNEYTETDAYSQSKLAVVLWTKELSEILKGTNVTVNVVHPGVVNTEIHRYMGFRTSAFLKFSFSPIIWFMMKPVENGAQTTIHCAVAEEVEGISGQYFTECAVENYDEEVVKDEVAKELYKKSLEWTSKKTS